MTAIYKHPEFKRGILDMASAAPGIAAWGLMTGVAMIKSGLSLTETLLMCVLVFAGSSQLAALPLIVAGAPMWVVLATGFCVNLRFAVFSAHLRPYVMHQPLWRRLVSGYFTADLSYVLFGWTVAFSSMYLDKEYLKANLISSDTSSEAENCILKE